MFIYNQCMYCYCYFYKSGDGHSYIQMLSTHLPHDIATYTKFDSNITCVLLLLFLQVRRDGHSYIQMFSTLPPHTYTKNLITQVHPGHVTCYHCCYRPLDTKRWRWSIRLRCVSTPPFISPFLHQRIARWLLKNRPQLSTGLTSWLGKDGIGTEVEDLRSGSEGGTVECKECKGCYASPPPLPLIESWGQFFRGHPV